MQPALFSLMKLTVKLNINGLKTFQRSVANGNSPAVLKTLKQWAVRYRSFLQRRFSIYSAGGGDWPPLKEKTIKQRGKGDAILYDTGTVFRALGPVFGQPGSFEEVTGPFQIEVGFGGEARHPKGKATIADIATFHNYGMGNLPERKIIVQPDEALKNDMAQDAERNLNEEAKRTIG